MFFLVYTYNVLFFIYIKSSFNVYITSSFSVSIVRAIIFVRKEYYD